jgi:starch phosphorylase
MFREFDELYPKKFNNKTNGITPRRWLLQANPELSELITSAIGDGWPRDLTKLRELERFVDDASFREKWREVKLQRKRALGRWMSRCARVELDPASLFDVQIKRMHEYKRQLLNVMHVISLYHRLSDGEGDVAPRTVIFGGKAAPSYLIAKLIIKLIHDVAAMVRTKPIVSERLNVVFVPNYDVSAAQLLFPATELSEQISTAGTEASGTGCMKAVLNGGVIVGTLDGANIEIREQVGDENMFVFGHTAEQVAAMRGSYDPKAWIEKTPALKRVIETMASLSNGQFRPLVDILTGADHYFHCADFGTYLEAQNRAAATELTTMSILNTARSGWFSADRTIAEYASEIWGAEKVDVEF